MSELAQVLRHLVPVDDPNALVDASTGDDAAVYRLDADRALVVTTDFFTPIVDDAFDFGRIAAANALSDLYAMGARPLFALNLVGFPRRLLGEGLLEEIVRGGGETCARAGISVLGGHSIDDPEPKYGLVAVGEVHPDRMLTNAGARAGDVLLLTKPLGTGVVTTALKAGKAPAEAVERAVESMATLNAGAAQAAMAHPVHAVTDISGYGLLGHLRNLLRSSGVAARLHATDVPLLPGALELAGDGHVPGGTERNLADLVDDIRWAEGIDQAVRLLLADAQTSGGLLVALPSAAAEGFVEDLKGAAPVAAVIGEVVEGPPGHVRVV